MMVVVVMPVGGYFFGGDVFFLRRGPLFVVREKLAGVVLHCGWDCARAQP